MALILIADDDRATRETLASLLRDEGHETYAAPSAYELLDLACQHPDFDLALTDLKMPRMDGIQLLDALRRQKPQARVILMSAFSTADSVVAALRLEVADYLQKPFDWAELQAALRRALGPPPRASNVSQERERAEPDC
jgi:DNA-binding NtrC family response regulator